MSFTSRSRQLASRPPWRRPRNTAGLRHSIMRGPMSGADRLPDEVWSPHMWYPLEVMVACWNPQPIGIT